MNRLPHMVTIQPFDRPHLEQVLALQVATEQQRFVAPNLLSIVESRIYLYLRPTVIMARGLPVGFILYGRDPETQVFHIVRLMVDQKHQPAGMPGRRWCFSSRAFVRRTQTRR